MLGNKSTNRKANACKYHPQNSWDKQEMVHWVYLSYQQKWQSPSSLFGHPTNSLAFREGAKISFIASFWRTCACSTCWLGSWLHWRFQKHQKWELILVSTHQTFGSTPKFVSKLKVQTKVQLVVEPTHLKNMRKSNWIISLIFGMQIKNIWVATHPEKQIGLIWISTHPISDSEKLKLFLDEYERIIQSHYAPEV